MRGINSTAESMPRNRLQVAINFLKYHFRVDGAVVERREEFQQLGDSFSHQAAWTAFPLALHVCSVQLREKAVLRIRDVYSVSAFFIPDPQERV